MSRTLWNIDQQLRRILNAHDVAAIILTNKKLTALGIGKATNPFKVFVAPGLLPFDVLVFFHDRPFVYQNYRQIVDSSMPLIFSRCFWSITWRALASGVILWLLPVDGGP
jgi:hypothetical protein